MDGWQNEKHGRSGKAPLSVLSLFGNVMTTKAAPARPPPCGAGAKCSSVQERTDIKGEKKNVIKM